MLLAAKFFMLCWVTSADFTPQQQKKITIVVKKMIYSMRYNKKDSARQLINAEHMSAAILGPTWLSINPAQQDQITRAFGFLIIESAFHQSRNHFRYLDAITFNAITPTATSSLQQARCETTLVVHRDLKKIQIMLAWILSQENDVWKIVDIVNKKDSTVAAIRDEQVLPLLKKGGIDALLKALQQKVESLNKSS